MDNPNRTLPIPQSIPKKKEKITALKGDDDKIVVKLGTRTQQHKTGKMTSDMREKTAQKFSHSQWRKNFRNKAYVP